MALPVWLWFGGTGCCGDSGVPGLLVVEAAMIVTS